LVKSVVSVLLGGMILGSLENVILPFFFRITGTGISDLALYPWLNIYAFFPIMILTLIFLYFIKRFNIILYDLSAIQDRRSTMLIFVILLQVFIITTFDSIIIASSNYEDIIPWINMGLVIIAALSILAIKQLEEKTKNTNRISLLKSHLQQVESLLNTLQSQKHECSRHIQALQSLVHLDRNDEAKEYIDGIAQDYWQVEEMLYTGHPVLTGLVNSKRSLAESQGVEFAVAVKCDLSNINIPPWDLCSIVGNLLDNAIEAAIQDKDKPRVALEFKSEDNEYLIYVHNNGKRISETDLKRIFTPGFTTKGSEARGYGLYLVKKLLDRYAGDIEILFKRQTTIVVKLANGEI